MFVCLRVLCVCVIAFLCVRVFVCWCVCAFVCFCVCFLAAKFSRLGGVAFDSEVFAAWRGCLEGTCFLHRF